MDTLSIVNKLGTAPFTGDDSNATLFIVIMVVMAIVIVGMIAFSVISGKKSKNSEDIDNKDKNEGKN